MATVNENQKPPTDLPPVPMGSGRAEMYAKTTYTLPDVQQALDLLDAGYFAPSVKLREHLRRDAKFFGAEEQMSLTILGQKLTLEAGESAHGNSPLEAMRRAGLGLFGDRGEVANRSKLRQIIEDIRSFGYAPCWFHVEPSDDGSRWIPRLTPWPLEAVGPRQDGKPGYAALLATGASVPIEGESWVEFRAADDKPHRRGAVRPSGEPFVTRGYAGQDWAIRSGSVREQKYIGELPENDEPNTATGRQFAANVAGLARAAGGMIHKKGAKVYGLDGKERGHDIFVDLKKDGASDYAIAYLGQDGTVSLGDTGTYGARETLWGVAYDVMTGTVMILCQGLDIVLSRWALYNFGRLEHPTTKINLPDLEAETARAKAAERRPLMIKELEAVAKRGPVIREVVFEIADRYGQQVSEAWADTWTAPPPPPPPGLIQPTPQDESS